MPLDVSNLVRPPKFVVVAGTDGSGKNTYANHLESMGFFHVSAGNVIRNEAYKRGMREPLSRSVLSSIGDELKRQFGATVITNHSLIEYQKHTAQYAAGLVIGGLRRVAEAHEAIKYGADIIFIDASPITRYKRQFDRTSRENEADYGAFLQRGSVEFNGQTPEGQDGVYLKGVKDIAYFTVMNDGTQEQFFKIADQLVLGI